MKFSSNFNYSFHFSLWNIMSAATSLWSHGTYLYIISKHLSHVPVDSHCLCSCSGLNTKSKGHLFSFSFFFDACLVCRFGILLCLQDSIKGMPTVCEWIFALSLCLLPCLFSPVETEVSLISIMLLIPLYLSSDLSFLGKKRSGSVCSIVLA